MMRSLIFGCGYLGRRVASLWVNSGHTVFAVTRSAQNAQSFLQMGIQPLIGDVCDPASLGQIPDVETVLYSVGFDRTSGKSHEEVTCGGVKNAVRTIRGRCRRFIYISSTSVYGQSDGEWVDEDSECRPNQIGGTLNLAAEEFIREQFRGGGNVSFDILRLAGIYGGGRLLSRVEALRAGTPLVGRGDAWLNLLHVDDAVSAVVTCAMQKESHSTYNVVDDQPIERREYFGTLARLVDAPTPTFDAIQSSARGSGGLNKRCSNRKLRHELGWKPRYPSIVTGLPASLDG